MPCPYDYKLCETMQSQGTRLPFMTTDFRPTLIASDLEGVFLPEIWEAVAEATQIEALQLTTKDIKEYDELMSIRLSALREHNLTMRYVQNVIASMSPPPRCT